MRFIIGKLMVLIAVLSWPVAAMSQVSTTSIDSLFAKFISTRDPGCAVFVMKDGKRVFAKGYGVADLRGRQKISPATNFRLASLTKQFTAMSIMLLVHDGKLRYDEYLTDVFPDFPSYAKAITIRELLNHTSGLVDYEDIMTKQYAGMADTKIPQIKDAAVLDLLSHETATKFPPGTRWSYSNSGYVVLAMIVEKRSGMKFGDFLHQRIFTPLNMTGTLAYEKGRNEVKHRAYGHTQTSTGWSQTDQSSTSATLGDGGIYTSLNDLQKWDASLTHHTLLAMKEMEPALTAPVANGAPLLQPDGSPAPIYGFGWFLDPYRGHRRYAHYGETIGFRTAIQRFPDDGLTIVVLANRAEVDAPALAESVAHLYFPKP